MSTPAPIPVLNFQYSSSTPAATGTMRIGDKCYKTTGADGLSYTGYAASEIANIGGLVITCICILIFGAIAISSKNSLAIVMLVCCCSSMAGGIWNEFDIKSKQDAIVARSPATPCA